MNIITRGVVIEDSPATLLDRVQTSAGSTAITAEDFTAITVRSIDMDSDQIVKTTSIAPSSAVQTLAVADGWNTDKIGRNIRLALDGSHFPAGGRTYRVEVTYTPANGNAFLSIYELQCVETLGS